MALPIMTDKLKESAAKKAKNLTEEEKKALKQAAEMEDKPAAQEGIVTKEEEKQAIINPVKQAIQATISQPSQPSNSDGEMISKLKELSSLGLIGADEPLKQLSSLEGQLAAGIGKSDTDLQGGRTGGNVGAAIVSSVDDIVSKIKGKNMTSSRDVMANKNYLLSNPKVKNLLENQYFKQNYPNFWDIVLKKAGIHQ